MQEWQLLSSTTDGKVEIRAMKKRNHHKVKNYTEQNKKNFFLSVKSRCHLIDDLTKQNKAKIIWNGLIMDNCCRRETSPMAAIRLQCQHTRTNRELTKHPGWERSQEAMQCNALLKADTALSSRAWLTSSQTCSIETASKSSNSCRY